MDDFEEDFRKENFRRQVEASNAYHQKKLKSPDEVSKRLNYQDKMRGDPNSPFKGVGRRVGQLYQPPQPPKPRQPPVSRGAKPPNVPPQKPPQIHQQIRQKPPSMQNQIQKEVKQEQFKGIGHVVGSTKNNDDKLNGILAPQTSSYHNRQGVEMRTWNNLLNDPMDEKQEKCLSLMNEERARNNKPPLAFSRSCTLREQEQVEKVVRKEIRIDDFRTGIQERADQIPRCKKASEVFAVLSKSEKMTTCNNNQLTTKPTSNAISKQPITVKNSSNINKQMSPIKSTSTRKTTTTRNPANAVPKTSSRNPANAVPKKTSVMKPLKVDPVKAIFEKWMEKPAMRTTILGNYQVVGIVFADSDEGSSLIGAAILANIT